MKDVITRIAPSPTGYMHIGTARTALYNYLFAKKNGGEFLMRIEDTDVKRNRPEYESDIQEEFEWLGLLPDKTVRQSERLSLHQSFLAQIIDSGQGYISKEPSKESSGMVDLVRLKNPNKVVAFKDLIRGEISFDTTELGDFVIARNQESPLYHFAVVVDDADMKVSHVIRGEEHISNTPRQILIQEALGLPRPEYAHLPLNLAADRSKLSKRKGDVSVKSYKEKGYLPAALLNYLAVIGWTPPSGKEILPLDEMIREFDLSAIHKSGSVFDIEKLKWYNRQYLLNIPENEFSREALLVLKKTLRKRGIPWNEAVGLGLIPLLRERVSVWEDIGILAEDCEFDYFFIPPTLKPQEIPGKDGSVSSAALHLSAINKILSGISEDVFAHSEKIKGVVWDYATKEGRGSVLWPLRYALTGRMRSPDPFFVASVIGKNPVIGRIEKALGILAAS